MPIAIMWALGGGAALWGASKVAQNASDAANNTSNAILKLAVAGAIAFMVAKKAKFL